MSPTLPNAPRGHGKKMTAMKLSLLLATAAFFAAAAPAAAQQVYATPEEAAKDLIDSAKANVQRDEATVKYYYPEKEHVRLQPANAAMAPIYVRMSDFRSSMILGIVVGVYRKL